MPKKYAEYKRQFNALKYHFRLNEMNDSIECNGKRMTDITVATIESKMFDVGFTSAAGIGRSITRLASEDSYHPIKEWLDELRWNGEDIFSQLMSCIEFEHQGISERFMYRFLLGCIGKIRSDGWEQNVMPIIDGVQGVGKSHLVRWLPPKKIQKYYVEGGINPDSKDTKIRVVGNFLWEVGELQGMTRKADLEALKNIITQREITVRLPYGRFDISKPVTCSFVGTVNESGSGFLNDVTGNRRFVVMRINKLDWQYADLDQEQLWAQMSQLYDVGERGKLTLQETSEQNTINAEYDTLSHVEQHFHKHYGIDMLNYSDSWMPIGDIIDKLELHGLSKSNQHLNLITLAGKLSQWGCGKNRSNRVTGHGRSVCYSGIYEKTPQPIGNLGGNP